MKFADFVREDRRLQILIILAAAAGYGASHYLLSHALDAYAYKISMDALKTDLAWLEEQGLITSKEVDDAIVVNLTQRGLDVSGGRVVVPGVKRPKPE
jgi:hypothetical protein